MFELKPSGSGWLETLLHGFNGPYDNGRTYASGASDGRIPTAERSSGRRRRLWHRAKRGDPRRWCSLPTDAVGQRLNRDRVASFYRRCGWGLRVW